MPEQHTFRTEIQWTGNLGTGTSTYTSYSRNHILSAEGKSPLECCSAPEFRGNATMYNPEDMLLYSVSSCHMLWFLHCCADAGVIVIAYSDKPQGSLVIDSNGIGKFTTITLHPQVIFQNPEDEIHLTTLHERAHKHCFIANSLNCEVTIA